MIHESEVNTVLKVLYIYTLTTNLITVSPTLTRSLIKDHPSFTRSHSLRIAVGTWNVNGGKTFQSIAYKNEKVTDWLLDLAGSLKNSGLKIKLF